MKLLILQFIHTLFYNLRFSSFCHFSYKFSSFHQRVFIIIEISHIFCQTVIDQKKYIVLLWFRYFIIHFPLKFLLRQNFFIFSQVFPISCGGSFFIDLHDFLKFSTCQYLFLFRFEVFVFSWKFCNGTDVGNVHDRLRACPALTFKGRRGMKC